MYCKVLWFKILLFVLFLTGGLSQAQIVRLNIPNESQKLFAVRENGKYGLADSKGKFIIPPQFDSVIDFHELYSHNFYVVNQSTEVKEYYENVIPMLRSYVLVLEDGGWGVFSKKHFAVLHRYERIQYVPKLVNIKVPVDKANDNEDCVWVQSLFLEGFIGGKSNNIILKLWNEEHEVSGAKPSEMIGDYGSNQSNQKLKAPKNIAVSTSYTVNIYDEQGRWYETGLLIKSQDKIYIKVTDDLFELIKSENENYTYRIVGKKLYVK